MQHKTSKPIKILNTHNLYLNITDLSLYTSCQTDFLRFPVCVISFYPILPTYVVGLADEDRKTRWLPKIYGGDLWFITRRQTVFIKRIIIGAGDEKSISTGCQSGLIVSVHLSHNLVTVSRLVSWLLSISQTPPPHAHTSQCFCCLLHF